MGRLRRLRPEECLVPARSTDAVVQLAQASPPRPPELHGASRTTVEPIAAAPSRESGRGGEAGVGQGKEAGKGTGASCAAPTLSGSGANSAAVDSSAHTAAVGSSGAGVPESEAREPAALIQDYIVLRHALDAKAAGVPKIEILKWVVDCSRNFFVQDEESFELAWYELSDAWMRTQRRRANQRRKREVAAANARLYADELVFGDVEAHPTQPGGSSTAANQQAESRKRGRARAPAPVRFSVLPEIRACSQAATADLANGVCESYDQALAVRLALALGKAAPKAMAEVAPDAAARGGLDAVLDDEGKLTKRLALFVHPDKTRHPQAKEAFQRLRERVW
mmetsp:Transcript_50630/g.84115  ORF Transcript_50630/g.84115 Transcript_50630/m.84115 type:complete len:338 (+) Transcript_50630:71-1084(+)